MQGNFSYAYTGALWSIVHGTGQKLLHKFLISMLGSALVMGLLMMFVV